MTSFAARACAYYRTSSLSGVGEDFDSKPRQEDAIRKYAQRENIEIVREAYDAAVKGADPVMSRPQFPELFDYMVANGIKILLVENASRFARDLVVQLTGHDFLKKNNITLVPVDAPDYFTDETPTAILIRQILGAVAEFEKRNSVERMKVARERIRMKTGRCEGRKRAPPEVVKMAIDLRSQNLSLRQISERLAERGHTIIKKSGKTKKPYPPASIKYMIENLVDELDLNTKPPH